MSQKKESFLHWGKRYATGKLTSREFGSENDTMEVFLRIMPVSEKRKQRARRNMFKVYKKTWGGVGRDIKFYKRKLGVK